MGEAPYKSANKGGGALSSVTTRERPSHVSSDSTPLNTNNRADDSFEVKSSLRTTL